MSACAMASRRGGFDDFGLVVGQAVELVDEVVDLPVGRVDLPLELLPPLGKLLGGEAGVEGEHGVDEGSEATHAYPNNGTGAPPIKTSPGTLLEEDTPPPAV